MTIATLKHDEVPEWDRIGPFTSEELDKKMKYLRGVPPHLRTYGEIDQLRFLATIEALKSKGGVLT